MFWRKIFGSRRPEESSDALHTSNRLDGAYARMRYVRTQENYRLLLEALWYDLHNDFAYPIQRDAGDLSEDMKQGGGIGVPLMNTPVGTFIILYTDFPRLKDKEGSESAEIVLVKGASIAAILKQEDGGVILNPYDYYGGVVVTRADFLAAKDCDNPKELAHVCDLAEGSRLNLSLAYWWLVENGRYPRTRQYPQRTCEDCGAVHLRGVVCPICGYNAEMSDGPELTDVSEWNGRHDLMAHEILSKDQDADLVRKEYDEFLKYVNDAAREDADAAHFLGKCLIGRSANAAFNLWEFAARSGNAAAMVDFGNMVASQDPKNVDNAFGAIRMYRLAMSVGMPTAARNMSLRYNRGIGVKRNPAKSFSLAKAVFEAGIRDGACALSRLYELGEGCAKDDVVAFQYAVKGCELADADSEYQLSRCYRLGIGTAVDENKANALFASALEHGSGMLWVGVDGTFSKAELKVLKEWAGVDAGRMERLHAWAKDNLQPSEYEALLRD